MAKKNVNKFIKNKEVIKTKDIVKEKISKPLYYHSLTDRTSSFSSFTIYSGYNASRLKKWISSVLC